MTLEEAAMDILTKRPDFRSDQGRAFAAIYYRFKLADDEGRIGIDAFNKIKPDSVVRALRMAKEKHDSSMDVGGEPKGRCICTAPCTDFWRQKKDKDKAIEIASKIVQEKQEEQKATQARFNTENSSQRHIGVNKSIVAGYAEATGKSLEESAQILGIEIV